MIVLVGKTSSRWLPGAGARQNGELLFTGDRVLVLLDEQFLERGTSHLQVGVRAGPDSQGLSMLLLFALGVMRGS